MIVFIFASVYSPIFVKRGSNLKVYVWEHKILINEFQVVLKAGKTY